MFKFFSCVCNMIHVIIVLYLIYKNMIWILELVVLIAGFSSVYSPIFKGSFLQLQSMSLPSHVEFILTFYHFFILFFFFCFFFFFSFFCLVFFCRLLSVLCYFFIFSFFFFFFFLTWVWRAFCRTWAVPGKIFYLLCFAFFYITRY